MITDNSHLPFRGAKFCAPTGFGLEVLEFDFSKFRMSVSCSTNNNLKLMFHGEKSIIIKIDDHKNGSLDALFSDLSLMFSYDRDIELQRAAMSSSDLFLYDLVCELIRIREERQWEVYRVVK